MTKIRIEEVPSFIQSMVDGHRLALRRAGEKALHDGVVHMKAAVRSSKPYAAIYKSKLINSFYVKRTMRGAELGNKAKHFDIIDGGASPHVPPYTPIAKWVAKKTGAPRRYVGEAKSLERKIFNKSMGKLSSSGKRKKKFSKKARGVGRKRQLLRFASIVAGTRRVIYQRGILSRKITARAYPLIVAKIDSHVKAELRNIR